MTTPIVQILSPARDIEVAKAAIQAGADAVYIGAPQFGARQAAANSLDDIARLVQYAHSYQVQVLVTLNTLLHESEYTEAVRLAQQLYQVGVDALIIQDLHLLDFDLPPIRLHASTQCDNRTPEQVVQLQAMGFRRAVLARELSLEEIRAIRQATRDAAGDSEPIELEAFVHGALCVSYSGRCYLSEVLTGRSANRGCCAQMCRMRYDLLDAQQREVLDEQGAPIHQRYLLSLQDLDRSDSLRELIDAGVTTLKIEGRLKDADYVTNIVAYYRMLLSQMGISNGKCYTRSFTPNPEKTFHRGGTDYFLHGRTPHMASWDTPKSTGEYIGRVVRCDDSSILLQLSPHVVLHNGDGLCYADQGFSVNRVEGARIYPHKMPTRLAAGTPLYRNQDTTFSKQLQASCRIPIRISLQAVPDGFMLQMGAIEQFFPFEHQPAEHPDKAADTIRVQLSKLGDTPYCAEDIHIDAQGCFIPIGTLNQWRRELVARLGDSYSRAAAPRVQPSVTASHSEKHPLMTCRYCILHELGHCRRIAPMPYEPAFLRLRTGQMLALHFDCARCEMTIDLPSN